MANLASIYAAPAADDVMEYDFTKHQWMLKDSFIAAQNPALSPLERSQKRLSYSRHVYKFAKRYAIVSSNWNFAEWCFSCTAQGKAAIEEALTAQLEADSATNYDSLADQPPLDVTSGTDVGIEALRRYSCCPDAQTAVEECAVDWGAVSILLSKRFFIGVSLGSTRYADWGY